MPSPSTTGKFKLQALGENLNTWGLSGGLNGNWSAVDDAVFGNETMSLTGNKTLTTVNYAADNEVGPRIHRLTDGGLSSAPTITIPALPNWWLVTNTTSYDVTYSNGSNSATISADRTALIRTDGTNVYSLNLFTAGDQSTYAGGYKYQFSTTTTDADPGAGRLRLDNATPSSATGIYIDDVEANGTDISALLTTWDDSTSTVRGEIKIQSVGTPETFHIWQVSGLTDNSGYMDFTVTYVDGAGAFANNDEVIVSFSRNGDKGNTGATGAAGVVTAAGDGSVGAPGIAWSSDSDTGFYRTATGETSYSANGTQKFAIGPNGFNGVATPVYGFVARENDIGSTGSNETLDFAAYSVWYFEPTDNIDVDVTNVPDIGDGAVAGYAVITGGGDHTLTLKCEGATGGALTPGGVGLTLSTGTDRDVVAIIKTGTDEVMFKVAGAAIS